MNKAELSAKIADKCNVTKKQAEDIIDCIVDIVIHELAENREVTITGFGTFSSFVRKSREGVNPQRPTEKIDIHPTKVARFKPGKTLKDEMKKSHHKHEPAPEHKPAAAPEASAPSA